jgi:hypothetical protein
MASKLFSRAKKAKEKAKTKQKGLESGLTISMVTKIKVQT